MAAAVGNHVQWPGVLDDPSSWRIPLQYYPPHTLVRGHILSSPHPLGTGPNNALLTDVVHLNAAIDLLRDSTLQNMGRALLSTGNDSRTKTPDGIQNMPQDYRVNRVFTCPEMCNRFKAYADGPPGPGHNPLTYNNGLQYTYHHTRVQEFPIADPLPHLKAAGALGTWFMLLSYWKANGAMALVESEPSIQSEVSRQVIDALHLMYDMRYNRMNGQGPPRWKYPTASHWQALQGMQSTPSKKAGFPDRILSIGPAAVHNVAILEVKTYWSQSANRILRMFFSDEYYAKDTGEYAWTKTLGSSFPMLFLKQIWGEMTFFNVNFGAWTNGRTWLFFVKSGNSEITFSPPVHWDSPDLLQILAGFSMIAIESKEDAGMIPNLTQGKNADWGGAVNFRVNNYVER